MSANLLKLIVVLACGGCSAKPVPSAVRAGTSAAESASHATAGAQAGAAAGSAAISCSGTNPVPQSDASGQLTIDVSAGTGSLTFAGWPGMPNGVASSLSCRQLPNGQEPSIFCATADHAFAASVTGANATIFHGGGAPVGDFTCTSSGSLPPAPQDDVAKIKTGRYAPAMSTATAPPPACGFTDQLILDKTVIAGTYVVTVSHEPGAYCTPLDIAAKPSAAFSVVSATLEACALRINAVDAAGRALEILDQRQGLAPTDPTGPACGAGFGDLAVSTLVPEVAQAWSQMPQ